MIKIETPLSGKLIAKPQPTYYSKIDRTSDLLVASGKLALPGRNLVPPSYYIAPATVR